MALGSLLCEMLTGYHRAEHATQCYQRARVGGRVHAAAAVEPRPLLWSRLNAADLSALPGLEVQGLPDGGGRAQGVEEGVSGDAHCSHRAAPGSGARE